MSESFVWPGLGVDDGLPVWGHRDGMRIGLAPTRGPRGLLRIYTPYLGHSFPRMVNFISLEPTVEGNERRSQSELAVSNDVPGTEGLSFYPSDSIDGYSPNSALPGGILADDGTSLTLFVHTETFPDGAEPIVRLRFHRDRPREVELATFASPTSAHMASCALSATMGNYGLLRRLHLADRVVSANELWYDDDPMDALDFLAWRTMMSERLCRDDDGRYVVTASTDARHEDLFYPEAVAPHWHYHGMMAAHTWRTESDADPVLAINARRTYWRSHAPIPGGIAFENFELRTTFAPGQRFWFGVEPILSGLSG